MVDGVKTEGLRAEHYKLQQEAKYEADLREAREKHKNDLERTIETQTSVKTDLQKGYEITLSGMRDEHERKLEDVRQSNSKQIAEEKSKGEEEVEKVKSRYHEQIARYKENSEKQLEEMRRKNINSAEMIKQAHERGKA